MARDRNVYVWQAYVTVMSIVSLACLGALAFVIFQSGTNTKTVEAATAKELASQDALRAEINKRQLLEAMLGVGKAVSDTEFQQMKTSVTADEPLNAVVKTYMNDMALISGEKDKNYTKLVSTLMKELRDRNRAMESLSKRELTLTDEFKTKLEQETKAREAEKKNADDRENKLNQAMVKYTEDLRVQQEMISRSKRTKIHW